MKLENFTGKGIHHIYLVGGLQLTRLKNMTSSMGRMTSYILWKLKKMFETTNQPLFP
jgi:hypothetical protein